MFACSFLLPSPSFPIPVPIRLHHRTRHGTMGLSPARLLVRCGGGHSVNLASPDVTDRGEDKGGDAQLESKSTQAAKQMMEEYYFTFLLIGESFRIRVSFLLRGVSTPIALRTSKESKTSGVRWHFPRSVRCSSHGAFRPSPEKKRRKGKGKRMRDRRFAPSPPQALAYTTCLPATCLPHFFSFSTHCSAVVPHYFGSSRPLRRPPVACCRTLLPPLFPGHCMEKRNCRAEGAATTF